MDLIITFRSVNVIVFCCILLNTVILSMVSLQRYSYYLSSLVDLNRKIRSTLYYEIRLYSIIRLYVTRRYVSLCIHTLLMCWNFEQYIVYIILLCSLLYYVMLTWCWWQVRHDIKTWSDDLFWHDMMTSQDMMTWVWQWTESCYSVCECSWTLHCEHGA